MKWEPIETAPKDTALLLFGSYYEIGHFNTRLDRWVAHWDHRPLNPRWWQRLPEMPEAEFRGAQ